MKAFDPAALPMDTAFTYQGRLERNGQPVSGVVCSFQFGLYDIGIGGSPVGSGIQTTDLPLTNGLFTATVNFGPVYYGEALWLEIAAQCPGDTGYTTIGRQQLTATPYAQYALSIPLDGSGSAQTAARSDHDHYGQTWSGTDTGLTLTGGTIGLSASGSELGLYANSTTNDIALAVLQAASPPATQPARICYFSVMIT